MKNIKILQVKNRQPIDFEAKFQPKEMIEIPAVNHQQIGQRHRSHVMRRRSLAKRLSIENQKDQSVENRVDDRQTERIVGEKFRHRRADE